MVRKLKTKFFTIFTAVPGMLANRIKQIENRQFIPAVKDEQGNLQSDVKMISQTFERYYTKLYSTEGGASKDKMDAFFEKLELPLLEREDNHILDAALTRSEIETAIGKMAGGKTPGEDGFCAEFYKCFKNQLSPILFLLYDEIIEREIMPPSMCKAIRNISLSL